MSQFVSSMPNKATLWDCLKWGEAVLEGHHRPDSRRDAQLLLEYVLDYSSTKLLLERGRTINEEDKISYEKLILQRAEGIPLQHLTNHQEFMGLDFYVNQDVLIPRQDTEILIEKIIQIHRAQPIKTGIDIGTGSGCIGISLAHFIPELEMTLIDISSKALKVAEKNRDDHGLKDRICLLKSNVLEAYTGEKVDLIVSNPPYIALDSMEELMIEVKDHEPSSALTDGKDGLSFYREITREAKKHLKPGGLLAYEIGYDQRDAVIQMMLEADYEQVVGYKDLAGKDRVVIGRKKLSGL